MKIDSGIPFILCVNPWIHDYAAYDFWARPLGLLYLVSILRDSGVRIGYMDCLDRFHPGHDPELKVLWDGRGPYRKQPIEGPEAGGGIRKTYSRYGIDPAWFVRDLTSIDRPDLILVTSLMTYWATGVTETISVLKSVWPDVPVVLGGIYACLCPDHAANHSRADTVVSSAGMTALTGLASAVKTYTGFDLAPGIEKQHLIDSMDNWPYPAFDLQRQIPYVPVLTSRGCPFSCDYCASSYLEPRLIRRSWENVFNEIRYWRKRFGVRNFPFYDDALLVNGSHYAYPLFEEIARTGLDVWFHTPNALHVREITKEAARLMYRAGFKTIRLGLETTDFSSGRPHDVKVRAHDFDRAVACLRAAGFEKQQIGAYLLCGLPRQDPDQVKNAMDMVKARGIIPVLAYYTPIPHTKMWKQAVSHSRFDLENNPVFTNNSLFPCVSSKEHIRRISQLKNSG